MSISVEFGRSFEFEGSSPPYNMRYMLFAPFCTAFDLGFPSNNLARSYHHTVYGAPGALEGLIERLGGSEGAILDSGNVLIRY